MLIDSAKKDVSDKTADPDQLFWMMRQAPFGVDFAYTAKMIEGLKTIALSAPASCGDSQISYQGKMQDIGSILQALEMRLYDEYKIAVCAMSSEGGKMIRTLQTQSSEQSHFGNITQSQKQKGVGGFFAQAGQKQVI